MKTTLSRFVASALVLGLAGLAHAADPAADAAPAPSRTRVACVGDSITQGSGYAEALGKLLGPAYEVGNFGQASTTLLSKGDRPYVKEAVYRKALAFKPDVVVIMLGTNDTKPQNYKFVGDWAADQKALVASFGALESKPKIYLATPVPVYYDGNFGIDNARLLEGVIPGVRAVAAELGLPLIDMYAAMSDRPDLFYKDNIHPIGGGLAMALPVYKAITGKDADVPTQPPPPEQTRVACVGDSITEGSGYTEALQNRLGNRYIVRNFGLSGATLLAKGDRPYAKQGKYRAAKDFRPHVVILMLGTNDSKPQNFAHVGDFAGDLKAMLDDFATLDPKPRVFLARPVPVYKDGAFGIDDGRLKQGILPAIDAVAAERGLPVIDLYGALGGRPEMFKDNVHPVGGAGLMAKAAFDVLRDKLPARPVTDNLLRNPGIETGLEPWSARKGEVEVVSEPVKSGAKALKVTGRSSEWHGPGQDVRDAVAAKGKGYYNVRASVRLADAAKAGKAPGARVIVMTSDDTGTHYLSGRDRPLSATEWADIDDDVYVSWTGTLKGAFLYVETGGGATDDLVVDDFALSAHPK